MTRTHRANVADGLSHAWGDRLETLAREVEHIGTGWALFTQARVRDVMHRSRVAEGWATYFGQQALAEFAALLTVNAICPDCQGHPAGPGTQVCPRCNGAGHVPTRQG